MASWSYLSLSVLKVELGIAAATTSEDAMLRRVLEDVSRWVDEHCHRTFRTRLATRYYTAARSDELELDADLLSVTTLKTDGDGDRTYEDTWTATDYDLMPYNAQADEEPYTRLETTPDGDYSFPTGVKKGVELIGKWGYWEDLLTATSLTAEALDTSETGVDVDTGSEFEALQTILIDSEQMYITSISSNTLTVERAQNGTTAATHDNDATIKVYRYPGLLRQACKIQASRIYNRKASPYGVTGSPEFGTVSVLPRLDWDVRLMLDAVRNLRAV